MTPPIATPCYNLHLMEFEADMYIVGLFAFSALCLCIFAAVLTAVVSVVAGVASFAFIFLLGYALLLAFTWVGNGFFLPRWYRYSLFVVVLILCGSGIAMGVLTTAGFAGFSTAYLSLAALLMLYGVLDLRGSDTCKVAFSDQVVPTFNLHVSSRALEEYSAPTVCVLISCVMLVVWGVTATLALPWATPGVAITCSTVIFASYFIQYASNSLGERLAMVADHITLALVQSIKDRALEHLQEVFGGGEGGQAQP